MESTRERVPANTNPAINRRIQRSMQARILYYRQHKDEIPARLRELDEEWDIERAIGANAASIALAGMALAAIRGRHWLLLPVAVAGFLLQHALQGWCPPVPVLRRLGFRTAHEIEEERRALESGGIALLEAQSA